MPALIIHFCQNENILITCAVFFTLDGFKKKKPNKKREIKDQSGDEESGKVKKQKTAGNKCKANPELSTEGRTIKTDKSIERKKQSITNRQKMQQRELSNDGIYFVYCKVVSVYPLIKCYWQKINGFMSFLTM